MTVVAAASNPYPVDMRYYTSSTASIFKHAYYTRYGMASIRLAI